MRAKLGWVFIALGLAMLPACGGFPSESELLRDAFESPQERTSKHSMVYEKIGACISTSCGASASMPTHSIEAIKCNTLKLAHDRYQSSCDPKHGAIEPSKVTDFRQGCSLHIGDISLLYESMRLLGCL